MSLSLIFRCTCIPLLFQFALEEYCQDENLITHIVDKYAQLATSAGPQFTDHSPIQKFIEATSKAEFNSPETPTPVGPGAEKVSKKAAGKVEMSHFLSQCMQKK